MFKSSAGEFSRKPHGVSHLKRLLGLRPYQKKKLQSQVAMPCPDINHMRHASISHHVPRDDHVGRIHLFLLASRKGEVATVPSTATLERLLCAPFSNLQRYHTTVGNCHGHAQRRVTTVGTNLQNASTCLKRKVEKGRGRPLRRFSRWKTKKKTPVTKKTWDRRKLQKLRVLPATFPASKRPHTWRTSFHRLPQHGGFMTPGHLVAPGKAEGKEVNWVNHLGYEDAKVWRIGSTPPRRRLISGTQNLGGIFSFSLKWGAFSGSSRFSFQGYKPPKRDSEMVSQSFQKNGHG